MKRPKLTKMRKDWSMSEMSDVPRMYMTMSEGQWDTILQVTYDMGGVLIELDENENFVSVYKKIDRCSVCGNDEKRILDINKDNETNITCESCGNQLFDEDYDY